MLLHFLVCPRLPSPLEKKNKEKLLQSNENDLGAKRVKLQKYEAIKKALKKGLLILRRENVLDPSLNIEATYWRFLGIGRIARKVKKKIK